MPRLSRNVRVLSAVSFLTDVATEMLTPLFPLFLTTTLGASPALLGLIDGIAEGISSGLRWVSGSLSDRFRRRKPFIVAGYTLSAVSKPLMGAAALAIGWPLFFLARATDRLGKSIRTSARDALIADSTPPELRGTAFGFHRAADTAGAVLGPLIALLVLWRFPTTPLYYFFFLAFLPGIGSSLLSAVAVKDITHSPSSAAPPALLQKFPRAFWLLIAANSLFSLGNSSDSFLILRSNELGLSFQQVILAFALYNTLYAVAAYPLGKFSDKIGRKPILLAGWLVYAAVYSVFSMAHTPLAPWLLFPVYGIYQALTEGISKAYITDLVPKEQRAGAIGLFYTVSGIGQLAASLLAGVLWKMQLSTPVGQMLPALALGGLFALLAVVLLALVPSPRIDHSAS